MMSEFKSKRNIIFLLMAFMLVGAYPNLAKGLSLTSAKILPKINLSLYDDDWLAILLDEVKKQQVLVEKYSASEPNEAFEITTPYWLQHAVSQSSRQLYYQRVKLNETQQTALNKALDSLAQSVAKKISLFKPKNSFFAVRNPADEDWITRNLKKFKEPATFSILKIGFEGSVWLIEKNDLGIPLNRYKRGYIWAKVKDDDQPYCRLYAFYLQQNYTGGGGYGQPFGNYDEDQIVGCP
ncbi:MAG: hypothetical protein AAB336_02900 [Acidobacteriota bacterium]